MPSIIEVLQQERDKAQDMVLCFEEGLFLKAFEESAWRLAMAYGFRPLVREVKAVGTVVRVGFPTSHREKYLPGAVQEGGVWQWKTPALKGDEKPFAAWKQEAVQSAAKKAAGSSVTAAVPPAGIDLVSAVCTFPLESKTPMECMLFVAELKRLVS